MEDSSSDSVMNISEILLSAIQTTNEMIIITDAPETIGEEKIVFVNKAFEKVTQYSKEEVLGKTPTFLQGPNTNYEVIDDFISTSNGQHFEGETFNYKKDGSRYRLRWSIDPIKNEDGEITHFVAVQRNITEEWKQRQKLQDVINEREVLVKETHHRIKNNLATITGLLELQIMKSDSDEVRDALSESMNRIQSIGSIHEKLYETEGLASITIDTYIKELTEQFGSSVTALDDSTTINFELDLQPVSLKTRQAVPLGLIINELITNAYKHAFDEGNGTVTISCAENDEQVSLKISDNGKGLPEDLDIQQINSLGLKLIETLAKQLEADFSLSSDNGTHFEMNFSREIS
ncbi:MAG: histidine kinase dimerization/phosphoacceptor domain -containing protein [Fodinibius sp.]|nr:histidine kinase dimerization/phosphoacceptor domain -containing protein [Fodinibius sp.]